MHGQAQRHCQPQVETVCDVPINAMIPPGCNLTERFPCLWSLAVVQCYRRGHHVQVGLAGWQQAGTGTREEIQHPVTRPPSISAESASCSSRTAIARK